MGLHFSMIRQRLSNPIVVVTLLLWAALYGLLATRASLLALPSVSALALIRVLTCSFGILSCGWLYLTLQPLRQRSLSLQIAVAFIASAIAAGIWTIANSEVMDYAFPSPLPMQPMTMADLLPTANLMFWFYIAWCFIYLSLEYRTALVDKEVDLARAREMALDAQNRMLRYQLNPHFLFNTLNALSALVMDNKRDQAENVLLALSRFLRYSLEQDPASKTELRNEIAAQEEYLAIEQIRFADKLKFVKSLEPEAMTALVPGFILQPAVENAIKYAVSPSTRPVTIEITANVDGPRLTLCVRDDGSAAKPECNGLGVGLENVRRRLELFYGSRAKMTSRVRESGGFEVELQLPLERK